MIEQQTLPKYDWSPIARGVSDTNFRITGLKQNQDYAFRIRGEFTSGLSEPSPYVPVYRRPSESSFSRSASKSITTRKPHYSTYSQKSNESKVARATSTNIQENIVRSRKESFLAHLQKLDEERNAKKLILESRNLVNEIDDKSHGLPPLSPRSRRDRFLADKLGKSLKTPKVSQVEKKANFTTALEKFKKITTPNAVTRIPKVSATPSVSLLTKSVSLDARKPPPSPPRPKLFVVQPEPSAILDTPRKLPSHYSVDDLTLTDRWMKVRGDYFTSENRVKSRLRGLGSRGYKTTSYQDLTKIESYKSYKPSYDSDHSYSRHMPERVRRMSRFRSISPEKDDFDSYLFRKRLQLLLRRRPASWGGHTIRQSYSYVPTPNYSLSNRSISLSNFRVPSLNRIGLARYHVHMSNVSRNASLSSTRSYSRVSRAPSLPTVGLSQKISDMSYQYVKSASRNSSLSTDRSPSIKYKTDRSGSFSYESYSSQVRSGSSKSYDSYRDRSGSFSLGKYLPKTSISKPAPIPETPKSYTSTKPTDWYKPTLERGSVPPSISLPRMRSNSISLGSDRASVSRDIPLEMAYKQAMTKSLGTSHRPSPVPNLGTEITRQSSPALSLSRAGTPLSVRQPSPGISATSVSVRQPSPAPSIGKSEASASTRHQSPALSSVHPVLPLTDLQMRTRSSSVGSGTSAGSSRGLPFSFKDKHMHRGKISTSLKSDAIPPKIEERRNVATSNWISNLSQKFDKRIS